MTYSQALTIAYDRQLFGAQAYAIARIEGVKNSSKEIFRRLCFREASRHISSEQMYWHLIGGWVS